MCVNVCFWSHAPWRPPYSEHPWTTWEYQAWNYVWLTIHYSCTHITSGHGIISTHGQITWSNIIKGLEINSGVINHTHHLGHKSEGVDPVCPNPVLNGCTPARFSVLPGNPWWKCCPPCRTEIPAELWPSRTGFEHPPFCSLNFAFGSSKNVPAWVPDYRRSTSTFLGPIEIFLHSPGDIIFVNG